MSQKKLRYSPRKTRIFHSRGDRWILLPGGGFGLQRPDTQDHPKSRA
jgi:hypothetical protein